MYKLHVIGNMQSKRFEFLNWCGNFITDNDSKLRNQQEQFTACKGYNAGKT